MMRWATLGLLLIVVGCGVDNRASDPKSDDNADGQAKSHHESDFTTLTLADFEVYSGKLRKGEVKPDGPTWREQDGVISCTGLPRGYLYTKKPYRNFVLEFEYRFPKPKNPAELETLNTGCLIYIQGEHRLWPACLEVQGKYVEMGMIKSNARSIKVMTNDEPRIRREFRHPPGDSWNKLTVQSSEGALVVQLNGQTLGSSEPTSLKEGLIGFQSEGAPVEFRNIRIRTESAVH